MSIRRRPDPQQSESHHRQRPRLLVSADRNQQRTERRTRSQNFSSNQRKAPGIAADCLARLCARGRGRSLSRKRLDAFAPKLRTRSVPRKRRRPKQVNQFRSSYADETPIRLCARLESRSRAVPRFRRSITTTPSPTSSAPHAKNPLSTKSRTENRTSINFQLENGVYIAPKNSRLPAISPSAKRNCTFTRASRAERRERLMMPTEPIQEKRRNHRACCRRTCSPGSSSASRCSWSLIMWLTGWQETASTPQSRCTPRRCVQAPLRSQRNKDRRTAEPHQDSCNANNFAQTLSRNRIAFLLAARLEAASAQRPSARLWHRTPRRSHRRRNARNASTSRCLRRTSL